MWHMWKADLDWTCETCLDITRELDRSNDYSGNESLPCKPSVRSDPTPDSLSPRCLNLLTGYSKHTGIDRLGPMNCNDEIVDRSLDTQAYSPFGFLAQLKQFIDFTVSKWTSRVQL
ncbi:hypothetical protein CRG98_017592 [Punica granatum]|uniref:Uncharacterized protein n=1 Tax=Punica granatum TaxID=22663 RepID=A0A2I0K2S1_PUNGR|nr:hypothetical protein CRG98_017592 [Punica granatum]